MHVPVNKPLKNQGLPSAVFHGAAVCDVETLLNITGSSGRFSAAFVQLRQKTNQSQSSLDNVRLGLMRERCPSKHAEKVFSSLKSAHWNYG